MGKAPTLDEARVGYLALWASMEIKPDKRTKALAAAREIAASKLKYIEIQDVTGVPWYVVGLIHHMEAGGDFDTHLHNGDPLRDKSGQPIKTRHVPKGRGPFTTWTESAVDALKLDGLTKVRDWSVDGICYQLEAFNGWGTRWRGVNTPYLWSFSNAYERGKYVADGVWSPSAVSAQCGAMPILKCLVDNGDVELSEPVSLAAPRWPVAEPTDGGKPNFPTLAVQSKSFWLYLQGMVATVLGFFTSGLETVASWVGINITPDDPKATVMQAVDTGKEVASYLSVSKQAIIVPFLLLIATVMIFRHIKDKGAN